MHRVVFASLLASCAGHPAPAAPTATAPSTSGKPTSEPKLREGPPLAAPGEHMQYKLSLQGIDLATYELSFGDITDVAGKRAIVVQGHAKTTGLAAFLATIDDRFTSWIDVSNGQSLRFQTEEYASGSKTNIEHVTVDLAGRDGGTVPVKFHVNEAADALEPQRVSQPVIWDYNAFLIALRSWEAPPGTKGTFEVFRSRFVWRVAVTIHGKEKLVTELGELPALRIDGTTYRLDRKGVRDHDAEERVFSMWISDDEGRVPLEIKATTDYGALRMQIVDYQPGTGPRLRP